MEELKKKKCMYDKNELTVDRNKRGSNLIPNA